MSIFIENKYTKWYFNIIQNADSRILPDNVYTERHHIIPRCLGGNDLQDNLATLTAKEHFICHLLLTKMADRNSYYKVLHAFHLMTQPSNHKDRYRKNINSKLYQKLKEDRSICLSEQMSGINNPMYGRNHSIETRKLQSRLKKGKVSYYPSEETKRKLSESKRGSNNPNYGKSLSDETKEKLSASLKGKLKGRIPWNKGKKTGPMSEEARAKISLARRNRAK